MRTILLCLLVACGGPSRQTLAETPTAQTPRNPSLAPPASGPEEERYQLNQQFEENRDAEQMHREAGQEANPPPPPSAQPPTGETPSGPPGETKPAKKGPAEQAPPKKKR